MLLRQEKFLLCNFSAMPLGRCGWLVAGFLIHFWCQRQQWRESGCVWSWSSSMWNNRYVTLIVVALATQEMFRKVVCPTITPVNDKDVKTWKLSSKCQSHPSRFTSSQDFWRVPVSPSRNVVGEVRVIGVGTMSPWRRSIQRPLEERNTHYDTYMMLYENGHGILVQVDDQTFQQTLSFHINVVLQNIHILN